MKYLITTTILILTLISCHQTKESELNSILLDCIIQSYQEKDIDIISELDELEDYLIESKYLKTSSGQSYYDFFQKIIQINEIPATLDIDRFENIYKLTPDKFYNADCLEKLKSIDSTVIVKSKYHQMKLSMQKASSKGINPSNMARAITEVLTPADFEHPYFRATALLSIAYTSDIGNGLKKRN